MNRINFKILAACIVSFILIFTFSLSYLVEKAFGIDQTVIKVGFYNNSPKLFVGMQGKPSGIFPEIIEDIARKESWQIKWVPGTWKESLSRLESGEIDIMPDVAYSLQRADKYEFADEPVLINWAVLYTREGIRISSLLDLAGKKIAVMRGSIHTEGQEGIKVLARKFRIPCTFIEYDNYTEVFLALQNNLADVGVVNRLFGLTSQKLYDVLPTSIVFNPRHLRFAFPLQGKLTPYLKESIDKHLRAAAQNQDSKIQQIIQGYLAGIPRESLYGQTKHKIFLTDEEKAWIAAHPKIRIGIDPEFAPFEFFDHTDEYSGYASDYIRLLNERLGLNMEVVRGHTWKEIIAMVKQKKIDVLPAVGYTEERSNFLRYTVPYIGFFRMIFCQADAPFISGVHDLQNFKVAVQVRSSHAGWIKDNTDLVPVYYDSLEDTIRAVSEGKADVFIGNLAASTYWIRKLNITNLRVAAPVSLQRQLLHMAVRKDWAILVGILNKGLASVSSEVAEDIRNRWTAAGYTIGISQWLFWKRIGLTLLFAVVLISFLWFWNRRLQREVNLRKKAENDLLLIQEGLAERVEERTRELALANISLQQECREKQELQEKLHRSEKMEALGLMAGGVAHDLNNILAGIVSYPDLLLVKLPDDSAMRKPLEVIKSSGKRAADVVSDLLTVARGVTNEKEPKNLNILINEFLDSPEYIQAKSSHPNITCEIDLDEELYLVLCSPIHIKKCLMNLVTNALEAIGGEGTLSIITKNINVENLLKTDTQFSQAKYIMLQISDSGHGISEDDIDHIFEPFYSKKVMGRSGTGLGLAVVWNTVQDHGGTIQVNSSNAGTIFDVYLPATDELELDPPQSIHSSEIKGNRERILVVDDEKSQRDVASTMLESMGYVVENVSSGEEALEYLRDKNVELVILDMIMEPGLSGLATYEQILQIVPGQKAIIVSGFSENEDVIKAQQLGATKYIKKPFTYNQLGLAVKDTLA